MENKNRYKNRKSVFPDEKLTISEEMEVIDKKIEELKKSGEYRKYTFNDIFPLIIFLCVILILFLF
jgi:hypothetical protein